MSIIGLRPKRSESAPLTRSTVTPHRPTTTVAAKAALTGMCNVAIAYVVM